MPRTRKFPLQPFRMSGAKPTAEKANKVTAVKADKTKKGGGTFVPTAKPSETSQAQKGKYVKFPFGFPETPPGVVIPHHDREDLREGTEARSDNFEGAWLTDDLDQIPKAFAQLKTLKDRIAAYDPSRVSNIELTKSEAEKLYDAVIFQAKLTNDYQVAFHKACYCVGLWESAWKTSQTKLKTASDQLKERETKISTLTTDLQNAEKSIS